MKFYGYPRADGKVSAETAEFQSGKGKKITLIEMLEEIDPGMRILRKPYLMQSLANCGVEILTSTRVETISEQGILATDKNGERKNLGIFDTIVLAMGAKPFDEHAWPFGHNGG